MTVSKRRSKARQTSLSRLVGVLLPRQRLLVVCEGEVTEPRYLEDFKRDQKNSAVDIDVYPAKGGNPNTMVARAVKLREQQESRAAKSGDDFERYDEVWVVFDHDSHSSADIQTATKSAKDANVRVAMSNPCFELWGIYHFGDQNAELSTREAVAQMRKLVPGYDKELPYKLLKPHYTSAMKRARAGVKSRQNEGSRQGNPSTTFYLLTNRIISLRTTKV